MASKGDLFTIFYVHVEALEELVISGECLTLGFFVMVDNYPTMDGGVPQMFILQLLAAIIT